MRWALVGILAAIVLGGGSAKADTIWTQKADMPTPRWFHSASVVDGKIYVIGGWPSEDSLVGLSAVEVYDPATDTWNQKADMLEPRGYHSSSVVNGKIYIIGGCGVDYEELSTVEEYDPATDTWTRKADMPTSRFCLSTSVVDGQIYAIGGAVWGEPSIYDTQGMSRVEVYNPATDTWTAKTNMPTRRWGLCSSVVDGKIYAIGGAPALIGKNKVEMYDPSDDSWAVKRNMPTWRRNFSTGVLSDRIYAIGGWHASGSACFSTVEVYDPLADSWMQIADLPAVRSCLSASIVGGKIYAIGGTPTPHPCPATSTVYEFGPLLDFNGDGIVDADDMCIMVDHWGTDYSLCDISPMPFGDGIVDVEDLVVLSEHLFEEVDDPTLIAHWPLDETEGMYAADSVSENNAIVVGGATWQPSGGQKGGALQLDGVSGCVVITNSILNPADGPFSIFAWIKGGAPGQVIVSQQATADWLATDAEGNLMTELKCTGSSAGPLYCETVITDGQWHRIGLVWDGSNRTLYVDGIMVAEDTHPGLDGSQMGLYIGVDKNRTSGTFFSGLIDDVRIYDRAITP